MSSRGFNETHHLTLSTGQFPQPHPGNGQPQPPPLLELVFNGSQILTGFNPQTGQVRLMLVHPNMLSACAEFNQAQLASLIGQLTAAGQQAFGESQPPLDAVECSCGIALSTRTIAAIHHEQGHDVGPYAPLFATE